MIGSTPYWAGVLGRDGSLKLNLQFARDQAYVSRIGPLPTFTRASTATRINSSGIIVSSAINTARIDYNPATLACRGLLLEEQRTNATIRSEEFENAAWVKGSTTATANQTLSPDGTVDADSLSEVAVNSQHTLYCSTSSVTSGTAYTASIFLKKGTGATAPDWIGIGFLVGGFGTVRVAFNVSTGVVGSTTGPITAQVTQFANGWWRVAVTATAVATAAWGTVVLNFTNNANTSASIPTYVGQTTSDIFVWGAQFEAGAFATSYIPTTSFTVIRSADFCSITGSAFSGFWNASEGTLVFKGMKPAVQANGTTYVAVDDNTANERLILYYPTNEFLNVQDGGVSQASISSGVSVSANTRFGMAARYKVNDFALSVSGGAVGTDVSGTIPSVSQMSIGSRLSTPMSLWVESIQYFNRTKTNAQLQALSAP